MDICNEMDDVEVLEHLMILKVIQRKQYRACNRELFKSRENFGFYNTGFDIITTKNPELFYKSVRMTYDQFKSLLELVRFALTKHSQRKPINAEQRLFITLYFLGHGCSMHTLSMKFRVGLETARTIVLETSEVLWRELHAFYVSPPTKENWLQIASKFLSTTGVPNCLGGLDGKHIRIKNPAHAGSQSSEPFTFYFVADAAFPLKSNIMKPFATVTDESMDTYNKKISKARVRIEMAFGILSSKWRILLTTINSNPENAKKFVLATIVLHNFLRLNSATTTDFTECTSNFTSVNRTDLNTQRNSSQRALSYRNILCNYFNY